MDANGRAWIILSFSHLRWSSLDGSRGRGMAGRTRQMPLSRERVSAWSCASCVFYLTHISSWSSRAWPRVISEIDLHHHTWIRLNMLCFVTAIIIYLYAA
ncbi:hypothetical protein F4814DRAFT_429876 [Daldinia grandis]|nr:hypothetical protein F4814DRAFT_429876 [Daldinia grandis]